MKEGSDSLIFRDKMTLIRQLLTYESRKTLSLNDPSFGQQPTMSNIRDNYTFFVCGNLTINLVECPRLQTKKNVTAEKIIISEFSNKLHRHKCKHYTLILLLLVDQVKRQVLSLIKTTETSQ